MRLTRRLRLAKTEQLDTLAHWAGIVYSMVLVFFWRILRKKNHWLSQYAMHRLVRNDNLHSQTVQGIIDIFYANIKSWQQLRKTNPKARLPRKRRWYFVIPYKEAAIQLKDKKLILSNGRGNAPLIIDWAYDKPKYIEISYDDGYIVSATYNVAPADPVQEGDTAGVDLGDIHIAAVRIKDKTIIFNGGELRSKRRYINKETGKMQGKIDKCKKGSKRRKKLVKAKKKMRKRLNNQIKDILHKQTTKLVYTLKNANVKTAAIGDVRNIRQNVDYGNHANQMIHQMFSGQARQMIEYKCTKHGMETVIINEAYSSQTCPKCLKKNKTDDRNYKCRFCGFEYHRDGVGAINIRQKQMYKKYVSVVGDMTPPVGMLYCYTRHNL